MSKYTHWYLVELDGLLRGQISTDRLHDLLNEIEEHLLSGIEDRMTKGMSAEEAELATLDSMGSPKRLADAQLKAVGKSRALQQSQTILRITPLVVGGAWLLAGFLGEEIFHPMVALFWIGALLVLIPAAYIAQSVPFRGLLVMGVCGMIGLATHQGISHVYVPNELTLVEARQQIQGDERRMVDELLRKIESSPNGASALTMQERIQLATGEKVLLIQSELAQPAFSRFLERLPQAFIALTALMVIHAAAFWLISKIPRRTANHWLHSRLA